MAKTILVLSTSPRKGGNSDLLADELIRGAVEAGHKAEKVCLHHKTIGFCKGCLACQNTHRCIIQDDMEQILSKMFSADVIVFATPIYFYEMCGQMKTLLDRTNPLYGSEYRFRDIYLLSTAADGEDSAADGAIKGLQGWIACFPKAHLAGTVFGGNADGAGTIKGSPALQEAYKMGKEIPDRKG